MQKYIVLLRGVNVGGKNLLPMKELKKQLELNGFQAVKTYIQSGNLVLLHEVDPTQKIESLINAEFGFMPKVLVLTASQFNLAARANPYSHGEGKTVHFYFCKEAPAIDHEKLTLLSTSSEEYQLMDNVFYLHAPDGIGRSKLVASIESCLGTSATGRNMNTVNKLLGMLEESH